MKTPPTAAEITRLRAEVKALRAVLQGAVEWDESLERDTPVEDLVTPEWRLEAVALLKKVDDCG